MLDQIHQHIERLTIEETNPFCAGLIRLALTFGDDVEMFKVIYEALDDADRDELAAILED